MRKNPPAFRKVTVLRYIINAVNLPAGILTLIPPMRGALNVGGPGGRASGFGFNQRAIPIHIKGPPLKLARLRAILGRLPRRIARTSSERQWRGDIPHIRNEVFRDVPCNSTSGISPLV